MNNIWKFHLKNHDKNISKSYTFNNFWDQKKQTQTRQLNNYPTTDDNIYRNRAHLLLHNFSNIQSSHHKSQFW